MNNDLIIELEKLVVGSSEFQELEQNLKYFCPFEAVGMTDQEIRHAHFLSYILDPNRPHGFEDSYLRCFLKIATKKALDKKSPIRPIDIHLMDLNEVRIYREEDRIDLMIEIPPVVTIGQRGVVLVFELKINAKEGKDQLRRYENKIREQHRNSHILFFFLTKKGEDPSEGSRDSWTPLAISDVLDEFNKIVTRSIGDEAARKTVEAYIAMMRRKHVTDQNDRLQQLVRKLWSEHKEALEFLSASQPDDVSDLLAKLDEDKRVLCGLLKDKTSWEFESESEPGARSVILYPVALDPLNLNDGKRIFVLVIDRNYGDRDKIRFRWLLRPGSVEARGAIYDKIGGKKRALTSEWTQIDVARFELKSSTGLPELMAKVVEFVRRDQSRFENLFTP